MKNVTKDALVLATNIINSLLPSKKLEIVNIAIKEPETFTIQGYPSIPLSFGYEYNDTPTLLEQGGVILGKTVGWWYVGINSKNSNWYRNRPQEIDLDGNIDEMAQKIGLINSDEVIEYYLNIPKDDIGPRKSGQMAILINKVKLQTFIDSISKSVLVDAPIDRKYWYDNRKLQFRLADESIDSFDFSKAEISRKLFEVFYELWKGDGIGEYAVVDIAQRYKKLHHEELATNSIGEIVSNIRASIINPKPTISKGIEWRFKRKGSLWIFKIHPLF